MAYSPLNLSIKNAHYFVSFPSANFPWASGSEAVFRKQNSGPLAVREKIGLSLIPTIFKKGFS